MSELRGGTEVAEETAPPIVIWTFRRTGGTSMRGILFWLTGRESLQDEAFNDDPPRQLGALTAQFRADGDEIALRSGMRAALANARPNLKHCIENVPFRLNSVLIEETARLKYRHILLLRLNEIDRQISLEMARRTGAWGPDEAARIYEDIRAGRREMLPLNIDLMRRQVDADAAALGKLMRLFMLSRQEPATVFFEDFYMGSIAERCASFRRLAVSVGIPRAHELDDSVFHKAAGALGQNSASMRRYVPNADEALAALDLIIR
jgi:hypothetical protein